MRCPAAITYDSVHCGSNRGPRTCGYVYPGMKIGHLRNGIFSFSITGGYIPLYGMPFGSGQVYVFLNAKIIFDGRKGPPIKSLAIRGPSPREGLMHPYCNIHELCRFRHRGEKEGNPLILLRYQMSWRREWGIWRRISDDISAKYLYLGRNHAPLCSHVSSNTLQDHGGRKREGGRKRKVTSLLTLPPSYYPQ